MKKYYYYLVTCRILGLEKEEHPMCEVRVSSKIRTFGDVEKVIDAIRTELVEKISSAYNDATISFAHSPYDLREERVSEEVFEDEPKVTKMKF